MNANQIADVRIALGSVAPIPIRCVLTEAALHGQTIKAETIAAARSALVAEIAPIDDLRSTRDYGSESRLICWKISFSRLPQEFVSLAESWQMSQPHTVSLRYIGLR